MFLACLLTDIVTDRRIDRQRESIFAYIPRGAAYKDDEQTNKARHVALTMKRIKVVCSTTIAKESVIESNNSDNNNSNNKIKKIHIIISFVE